LENGDTSAVLNAAITYNGSSGAPVEVGTYTVDISGITNSNYDFSGTAITTADFDITQKDITATIDPITINGNVLPAFPDANFNGLVSGFGIGSLDALTYEYDSGALIPGDTQPLGTMVNFAIAGFSDNNYNLVGALPSSVITLGEAPVITPQTDNLPSNVEQSTQNIPNDIAQNSPFSFQSPVPSSDTPEGNSFVRLENAFDRYALWSDSFYDPQNVQNVTYDSVIPFMDNGKIVIASAKQTHNVPVILSLDGLIRFDPRVWQFIGFQPEFLDEGF
jgi:hypothetical protein